MRLDSITIIMVRRRDRIGMLHEFLNGLKAAGVRLFIVSIGYKQALLPHLRLVGLEQYFDEADVYGQDSPELRALEFVKAALITKHILEPNQLRGAEVLFVDDSEKHIVAAEGTCDCFRVAGHGLTREELLQIYKMVIPGSIN